ncbi:MAG TPA: GNAT family N-acetyltransferase [Thermoanaerobaculia bacterium]|nr:GNAT family N-acetyltransferase [Thermoanaerobaculia bacterium]
MLPIETDRLRLRRLVAHDIPALAAYRSDERVARLQSWESMSREEAEELVNAEGELGDDGRWVQIAIARKDTDALLGDIGTFVNGDTAEIGFSLAPDAQGHGYATEACRAVIGLLFGLGLRRIIAIVDARNRSAIALLEGLGLTLERTAEAEFKGGMCLEHHYTLPRP